MIFFHKYISYESILFETLLNIKSNVDIYIYPNIYLNLNSYILIKKNIHKIVNSKLYLKSKTINDIELLIT